jgi:hypothetical protein
LNRHGQKRTEPAFYSEKQKQVQHIPLSPRVPSPPGFWETGSRNQQPDGLSPAARRPSSLPPACRSAY